MNLLSIHAKPTLTVWCHYLLRDPSTKPSRMECVNDIRDGRNEDEYEVMGSGDVDPKCKIHVSLAGDYHNLSSSGLCFKKKKKHWISW